MESHLTPSPQLVRDQLEKILASARFAASVRSQRFLRYVVEGSLKDGEELLKEYTIAVEVFDRDGSYDPSIDATVRVEAGRLRTRLREYYADVGRNDPVIIAIPKGGYRATFDLNNSAQPESHEAPGNPPPSSGAFAPSATAARRRLLLLWGSAASVLLFLALGSLGVYWSRHERVAHSVQNPTVLAVLPFANQTGVEANSYLSEGLTDNLIRQIAELPHIRVVSREAISGADPRKAAKELGVTVLLTGELQLNSGRKLVLNSELSNAADGTVMRSSQYLPDESDLRPVQADILRDVIQALGLQLNARDSEGVQRPMTASPAAFQDFLHGESLMLRGDEQDVFAALKIFEDAVRKDPSFAQAWTSMAAAQIQIALYWELPAEHAELARQYSERAIALDPKISEAHGVLGLVYLFYDWNFEAARREVAAADTREDAIWHIGCTAHLLDTSGDKRHAEEDLEHMLEFDPGSVLLVSELGCVSYYAGRYDESVNYYRQALATAPGSVLANWGLARSLGREGKYSEALADLKRFNSVYGIEHPLTLAEIGYVQAMSGDRPAAIATIHRLDIKSRTEFVDPFFTAQIYLALNDRDATFAWLDRAYKIRSPFLVSLATDPKWSAARGDPRFEGLWDRMTGAHHNAQGLQNTAHGPDSSNRARMSRHG